ncbi:MAG: LLM class flavin-dependent oxidoreductase, partial [Anaerolineae bacterium]|nr:LLM class flavin-dependent oxidoreductase [Anaerolineae bacterium]
MNIQFGFCLPIFAWPGPRLFRTPAWAKLDAQRCMALGKLADELGYHSLWVADHLMLGADDAILEGWTTLAALAGMTQQAKLGIIHYNNVFRHPAFTAKMVATLDQISGGRMIHFVDFGNNAREYLAYGLLNDLPRETRIARMIEGLELTQALWQSDAPVTFHGAHYITQNAVCTPKPLQAYVPVWMGEVWPGMVEATVKYADAWNTVPAPMDELKRRLGLLADECQKQGREYATLEKTLEIQVLIAPTLA